MRNFEIEKVTKKEMERLRDERRLIALGKAPKEWKRRSTKRILYDHEQQARRHMVDALSRGFDEALLGLDFRGPYRTESYRKTPEGQFIVTEFYMDNKLEVRVIFYVRSPKEPEKLRVQACPYYAEEIRGYYEDNKQHFKFKERELEEALGKMNKAQAQRLLRAFREFDNAQGKYRHARQQYNAAMPQYEDDYIEDVEDAKTEMQSYRSMVGETIYDILQSK